MELYERERDIFVTTVESAKNHAGWLPNGDKPSILIPESFRDRFMSTHSKSDDF